MIESSNSQLKNDYAPEYVIFFIELKVFAEFVEFKFSDELNIIEIMCQLDKFFLIKYSNYKYDFLCFEIFGISLKELLKFDFHRNSQKLKKITVALFLIRILLSNNEFKEKSLMLTKFLDLNFEELFIAIKKSNKKNDFNNLNIKMSDYFIVMDEDKIVLNAESLLFKKNQKIYSLEEAEIKNKRIRADQFASDKKMKDEMYLFMIRTKEYQENNEKKIEELDTKLIKSKKEHKSETEKLERKMKTSDEEKKKEIQELETKLMEHKTEIEKLERKMKTSDEEKKKEKEELETKLIEQHITEMEKLERKVKTSEEEIGQLKDKVFRLERINYSVWLREIIQKVYLIIKKVYDVTIIKNENKQKEIENLSNKQLLKHFSSENFPFSETIIKLLKLKKTCDSLLNLQNSYQFKESEDLNSAKRVVDILKVFSPDGMFEIKELENFASFLEFINFNKTKLKNMDKNFNLDNIYYKLKQFNYI